MKISSRLALAAALAAACGLALSVHGQPKESAKDTTKEAPKDGAVPISNIAFGEGAPGGPGGPGGADESGLRPFADVAKGFEKVVSTADGKASYYTVWTKEKDGSMLAELPRGFEGQKEYFAMTVAGGETYAGLQQGAIYAYWKRFDNRLMLIEPVIDTRSTGDAESKSSVKRLFTERVVLDIPIVAMGPGGNPVIDMKDLLANRVSTFFGNGGYMSSGARGANPRLAKIKAAKAFPQNIEISYEMPADNGHLKTFHYSISLIPESTGYQPRVADERVGYFTTVYRDLGKFTDQDKWIRYINRWDVQKKDPKLKLSPPKDPIVFYIENSVPVRYRRFVRDGLLAWNKAFEKIGVLNAIEVYQQDAETGAHMEKDPEDVRYNFVRWLSNDIGTAIGPSRTNPLTGQIFDADIVLTDGWIRHFWMNFNEIMPELAMEGFSPETMAWLEKNPKWDPRVLFTPPEQRDALLAARAARGVLAYGGHAIAAADPSHEPVRMLGLPGQNEFDGLSQHSQASLCMAANGMSFDLSVLRLMLDSLDGDVMAMEPDGKPDAKDVKKDEKKEEKKDDEKNAAKKPEAPKGDMLDGIPEWFIGPLLADLVMHESGHTLGLRHNFKASSIYTMAQMASDEIKGKKTFVGSVMDYTPINLNIENGKMQGDVGPIDIGPYDFWAIEYGYGYGDTKEVLKRVAEPELAYGTDEDVGGPDPSIRRYDFAKDPLEYAKSQVKLAKYHRGRLLDKFVKDGQSWARARRGYALTLGMQTRSINMMSSWVGGAYIHRDRKGDPNGRPPIEVVPAAQQRDALRFCIDNSFYDEAFGLTPELISHMTVDKWMDEGGMAEGRGENTWAIHDNIAAMQASVLTQIMNPTTLRRVYDNEFAVTPETDAVTLAELMDTVHSAVWSELDSAPATKFTARKPMISSIRRNLQREYLERLIDLSFSGGNGAAAYKPVSNLAITKLRAVRAKIGDFVDDKGAKNGNIDPYTAAHLSEAKVRIDKALDAIYVYNAGGGGGFNPMNFFFQPATQK